MKTNIIFWYYTIRRNILKRLVPEIIWPREVTIDGVQIPVRGMDYSFGVKRILLSGDYEVSERSLLKMFLNEGDKVLEMGGSIGVLTAVIAKTIGTRGAVISIEASDRLSRQSQFWLKEFGNVTCLSGVGFPVLKVPVKYSLMSFLDDGNSLGGMLNFDSNLSTKNNCYDIGRIEKEFNFEANVLVIDIEGSEIALMENGVVIPSYVEKILIELHPHIYGDLVSQAIIQSIVDKGYILLSEKRGVYLFNRNVE